MNEWSSSVEDWLAYCSQLKYITQKSEELASSNMEQKEKKKKKSSAAKGGKTPGDQEAALTENEDSNMAWCIFWVTFQVIFSYYPRETRISLFILQVSSNNESLGF